MSVDPCRTALAAFTKKEFASWSGLPLGCELGAVALVWSLQDDNANAALGTGHNVTYSRSATVSGYGEPVEVWYRDSRVVQISTLYPEISDPKALLATLGAPALKLDCYLQTVPVLNKGGEWVYPDRGLTFRMSSDHTNIIQVFVYPPTTAERYQAELYTLEAPRELD